MPFRLSRSRKSHRGGDRVQSEQRTGGAQDRRETCAGTGGMCTKAGEVGDGGKWGPCRSMWVRSRWVPGVSFCSRYFKLIHCCGRESTKACFKIGCDHAGMPDAPRKRVKLQALWWVFVVGRPGIGLQVFVVWGAPCVILLPQSRLRLGAFVCFGSQISQSVHLST